MKVGDALAARDAGADFVGVMFAQSRRRVSVEEAADIVRALGTPLSEMDQDSPPVRIPPTNDAGAWFVDGAAAVDRLLERKRPLVVGVFADQPAEEVNEICDDAGIDLIQLSGEEAWGDIALLNRQAINVIRSSVEATRDIEPDTALAVMLDNSRGTGTISDWTLARDLASRMPIWLAGGLTPDNVGEAIDTVRPWLVDVSTGVETDGAKDPAKIAAFVAVAKAVAAR